MAFGDSHASDLQASYPPAGLIIARLAHDGCDAGGEAPKVGENGLVLATAQFSPVRRVLFLLVFLQSSVFRRSAHESVKRSPPSPVVESFLVCWFTNESQRILIGSPQHGIPSPRGSVVTGIVTACW